MSAFFVFVNGLLDLKIVQWILLGLVCIMFIGNIVFTIKYNGLRLDNALLKADNAKINSALVFQNDAVKKMGEDFKLKEANIEQANKRASKIAVENKKLLKKISKFEFKKGATCNEKVKQVFSIISSNR
jgi:hypothetical protein